MEIKVVIADDHKMIAEGITSMLSAYANIKIIATYQTGEALLKGLEQSLPNILLLDINFPDITGNELAHIISNQHPQIRIIALTGIDNSSQIKSMIKNGCYGYLLKNVAPAILMEAIESVLQDKKYLQPELKDKILSSFLEVNEELKSDNTLTRREKEILQLIYDGLTNLQISKKLFLSIRTVENHRFSLYHKFQVSNPASLIKEALQKGLI